MLVNYYFLCMSRVKEKIVKIINKILFIVFSIILFFSKMIANGFVKEFFDVDIAKVPYISWSFSILFAIPFFFDYFPRGVYDFRRYNRFIPDKKN